MILTLRKIKSYREIKKMNNDSMNTVYWVAKTQYTALCQYETN